MKNKKKIIKQWNICEYTKLWIFEYVGGGIFFKKNCMDLLEKKKYKKQTKKKFEKKDNETFPKK